MCQASPRKRRALDSEQLAVKRLNGATGREAWTVMDCARCHSARILPALQPMLD